MKNWFKSSPMPQNKRPLLIGITGNIGSGKTTFAQIISEQGYTVISADKTTKDVLELPEVRQILIDRWGEKIVDSGKTDHAKIASIVFKQPTELAFLNSVVHPRVLKEFSRICAESTESVLFFEVPLLFEARLQEGFDYIILITSSAYTREQRLLLRDKSNLISIRERIGSQQDDADKKALVDYVIYNDGNLATLKKRSLRFLADISNIQYKKTTAFHSIPLQ